MMRAILSRLGPWSRRVVVAVLAVLVALAIIGVSLQGDERNLTAISIAVAVVFGAITSVQNARMQRRDHTITLLSAFSTADVLSESDARIARVFAVHSSISGSVDAEIDLHLIRVLDYYEFICGAALRRHIDADMVTALRGHAMQIAYQACLPYIEERRQRYGPELYRAFETFVTQEVGNPAAPAVRGA